MIVRQKKEVTSTVTVQQSGFFLILNKHYLILSHKKNQLLIINKPCYMFDATFYFYITS